MHEHGGFSFPYFLRFPTSVILIVEVLHVFGEISEYFILSLWRYCEWDSFYNLLLNEFILLCKMLLTFACVFCVLHTLLSSFTNLNYLMAESLGFSLCRTMQSADQNNLAFSFLICKYLISFSFLIVLIYETMKVLEEN